MSPRALRPIPADQARRLLFDGKRSVAEEALT